MRIAKPILLVSTPVGAIWGVITAYHIHAWLGWLMALLLTVVGTLMGYTVHVIRREQRQQQADQQQTDAQSPRSRVT